MDHQGLAHLLPPPTTEVTTLRPYHHLTRLSAPLLLALLLTVVTKNRSNSSSHCSAHDLLMAPMSAKIKFLTKVLHHPPAPSTFQTTFYTPLSMAPAMGLPAAPGPLTPPFLRASVIARIPPPVPVSLVTCTAQSYNSGLICRLPRATFTDPPLPRYIPSHTYTPLCFPGLFTPLTLTTFFFIYTFHYCLSPLTSKFTPRSKESLFCSSPAPRTVCHT